MPTRFIRRRLARSPCARVRTRYSPPRLEQLEDRLTPAPMTFTVTDTTDADANSLRAAITASNANAPGGGMFNTINFNISAAGTVQTISLLSALPTITQPVLINGYSEPGASMNTLANSDNAKILIELDGAGAGTNADGLLLGAGSEGSTIEGLAINRFSLNGIELQGSDNTIEGNFVGTNPQGNAAEPNQNDGIHLSNASVNTIGGTTPGARNVVSGNQIDGIHYVGTGNTVSDNTIEGNFVGVNAAGTGPVGIKPIGSFAGTASGNFVAGIEISGGSNSFVGGTSAADRNVVGFNVYGIEVDDGGEENTIEGNYVGVGADGVTPAGNNLQGIVLRSDDNLSPPLGPGQANEPATSYNHIGLDPTNNFTGLGNLIAFNGAAGVAVFGNPLPNNATPIQNTGNSFLGNSIFENGRNNPQSEIGIDLTNGFVFPKDDGVTPNDSKGHGAANDPNNFQNFPILTAVSLSGGSVTIKGTLTQSASPNTKYRIEFFVNNPDPLGGISEGQTYLGSTDVTTNASGQASFSVTFNANVHGGQILTATATNITADPSVQHGAEALFNTSEFSPGLTIPIPSPPSPPPAPPPTLQVPPLLAFIDSLLGGIERVNSNGTETITDSFFGVPLIVSTFDSRGNLESVDLFGMNVTFLFLL